MHTVLRRRTEYKRGEFAPSDPHGFESFGSILRRMRGEVESQMTPVFSLPLSLKIDFLVAAEQRNEEDCE
jgi:hypothetical protein